MLMIDISLMLNIGFWYLGNYYYNIQNKNASNASNGDQFAITIATSQLGIGVLYSLFLWIIPNTRNYPKIYIKDIFLFLPAGLSSSLAHVFSVLSLASGGLVFGQIVKASEPVFAGIIGTLFYKKKLSFYRWICLSVIIFGVCLASLKNSNGNYDLDFNLNSLIYAVMANIFASFKGAENKKIIENDDIKLRIGNISNQYAIMNIISFLFSIPIMIYIEGSKFYIFYNIFLYNNNFYNNVILSGFTFYLYNELAMITLKKISAVNQSIANTVKRVIIIISSAIIFNESISQLKIVGCVLCISGVFLDSIIDDVIYKHKKIN